MQHLNPIKFKGFSSTFHWNNLTVLKQRPEATVSGSLAETFENSTDLLLEIYLVSYRYLDKPDDMFVFQVHLVKMWYL